MERENVALLAGTIVAAEKILANAFGGRVRLDEGNDLGGSKRTIVLRCRVLQGPAGTLASVIIKQSNDPIFDPDAASEQSWFFFNDWAAIQFLSSMEGTKSFVPTFYGGDREIGVFVLEDLGQGMRLDHLLLANDPVAAEEALLAYAALHGRLHALTRAKQAEYLCVRERLGPSTRDSDYYRYRWLTPTLHTIANMLNIPVQPGADDELTALAATLVNPGSFLTLIQSDAAPDNCLFDGTQWRLFDFEGSHYTHALLEGVYYRMPFPTCWCVYRLPEVIMQRAEAAYRAELVEGCPEAADDTLFYHGVVEACVTWVLNFQFMRPLEKMLERDRRLVALTDRQRFLLYLNSAVRASEEFAHLQATGATLHAIADRLAQLWPEANDPPYYPAFLPLFPMHD